MVPNFNGFNVYVQERGKACKQASQTKPNINPTKHQFANLPRNLRCFFLLLFLLCGLEPVTRTAIILGTLIFGNLSPGAFGCECFQVTSGGGLKNQGLVAATSPQKYQKEW